MAECATLQKLCISSVARACTFNTFSFKSFSILPAHLLQELFNEVYRLWPPNLGKQQVLRLVQLFCEPSLNSLLLDKVTASEALLSALVDQFKLSSSNGLQHCSLRLSTTMVSPTSLAQFISCINSITSLTLVVQDDTIATRLFRDLPLDQFLPCLQVLRLDYRSTNPRTHLRRRSSVNIVLPNAFLLDICTRVPTSSLTYVSMMDRTLLTPTTIKAISLRAPFLRQLLLDGTEVTDSNIVFLTRSCRHLETLSLRGCRRISDEAFVEIGRGFLESSLKYLSIAACRKLTDGVLGYLLEGCSLRLLDIRWCTTSLIDSDALGDVLNSLSDVIFSYNDAQRLVRKIDNLPLEKIHVQRRFYDSVKSRNVTQFYRLNDQSATSDFPLLPAELLSIWPVDFWTSYDLR